MSDNYQPKNEYCVWPFPTPPVCTGYWDKQSWIKWEDSHRPENYTGDKYDKKAWKEYCNTEFNKHYNLPDTI